MQHLQGVDAMTDWMLIKEDLEDWIDYDDDLITDEDEQVAREIDWIDDADWEGIIDEICDFFDQKSLQIGAICLICGNGVASCTCER
jgi:hypothetical protein